MTEQSLAVAGLGMISCLGYGAEGNAAAMRCKYDGFVRGRFVNPGHLGEQLVVAPIEVSGDKLHGTARHAHWCRHVVEQSTRGLPAGNSVLPVFVCLPEPGRPGVHDDADYRSALRNSIQQAIHPQTIHQESALITNGRVGFADALREARRLIFHRQTPVDFVLIIAIDSYLTSAAIHHLGGHGEQGRRLLCNSNPNGFIPGEAAAAVLVCHPDCISDDAEKITGPGFGTEECTLSSDEIFNASGLVQALRQTSDQAGLQTHEAQFRIAGITGEDYYFIEASRAQTRCLSERVENQPLWTPCGHIGEVGAASGPAIVIMGTYAFRKHYAPGPTALCHLSNDNGARAAFFLKSGRNQRTETERHL